MNINYPFYDDRALRTTIILAIIFLPVSSHADDGIAKQRGQIVIERSVPQHDAFRLGDKGQPTTIATARPDLVLESVRSIPANPISLSDINLAIITGDRPETMGMPQLAAVKIQPRMLDNSVIDHSSLVANSVKSINSDFGISTNIGMTQVGNIITPAFRALK